MKVKECLLLSSFLNNPFRNGGLGEGDLSRLIPCMVEAIIPVILVSKPSMATNMASKVTNCEETYKGSATMS